MYSLFSWPIFVIVLCLVVNGTFVSSSEEISQDFPRLPQFRKWLNRSVNTVGSNSEELEEYTRKITITIEDESGTENQSPLSEVVETDRRTDDDRQQIKSTDVTLSIAEAKKKLKKKSKKKKKDRHNPELHSDDFNGQARSLRKAENEAKKHVKKMARAHCSTPVAKLIHVHQYYPESNVIYYPQCTWLHRCGDDVGCCSEQSKTCSAIHVDNVTLHFFAQSFISDMKRSVVKLDFVNHTECSCIDRNTDVMPRTEEMILGPRNKLHDNQWEIGYQSFLAESRARLEKNAAAAAAAFATQHENQMNARQVPKEAHFRNSTMQKTHLPLHPLGRIAVTNQIQHRHQTRNQIQSDAIKCQCPYSYMTMSGMETDCICDCAAHNNYCLRLKQGVDTFSLRDRGCISSAKCQHPTCEFGNYIAALGRCPRRQEQSANWLKLVR